MWSEHPDPSGLAAALHAADRGVVGFKNQAANAPDLHGARALIQIKEAAKSGPVRASLSLKAIEIGVPEAIALTAAKPAQLGVLQDVE